MAQQSVARKVAEQAAREHPKVASRTLAKMLRQREPKLFSTVEQARSMVRTIRGNNGKQNRKATRDKSAFRPNGKAGTVYIPPGLTQGKQPLKIKGPCKALVLCDVHVPYQNAKAIYAALKVAEAEDCDTLCLNGDFQDFYSISRWETDPRERNFPAEVKMGREILASIAQPFKRKIYKVGNHDERWDTYLWQKAPDLAEFEEFSLRALLRLDEQGYELVESKQWIDFGKLHLLHGHELPTGLVTPVNTARGVWLRLSSTAAVGHSHVSSHHSETLAMKQEMVSCWSMGCLCDLRPRYRPINKWNLGFAIVEVCANGDFNFHNYKIDPSTYRVFRA